MTVFFQNFFNAGLTALRMTLCAAGGCPSFSARVTSVKYAAALKNVLDALPIIHLYQYNWKMNFLSMLIKKFKVNFKVQT